MSSYCRSTVYSFVYRERSSSTEGARSYEIRSEELEARFLPINKKFDRRSGVQGRVPYYFLISTCGELHVAQSKKLSPYANLMLIADLAE